ncbi:MAG: plasmid pRiA4b ORF-3 family protein, partial [Gammaproteobacteria bacterium]
MIEHHGAFRGHPRSSTEDWSRLYKDSLRQTYEHWHPKMAQALRNIYQLKITLKDSKPPIWRRLLIADTVTLAKLHTAIQIVMGWSDDHLHQFIAGKQLYGVQDSD